MLACVSKQHRPGFDFALVKTEGVFASTSRMTRECQVRIRERLGVKFPGPTRRRRSGLMGFSLIEVRLS
jgi:hypothetical protein